MAVKALYRMKEIPLPLAVDMYSKTISTSIDDKSIDAYECMLEKLEYGFIESRAGKKNMEEDWSLARNELVFSKGYVDIFEDVPEKGLWIAYEALEMLFMVYGDLKIAKYQAFYWDKKEFWICNENGHIIFFTPDEY